MPKEPRFTVFEATNQERKEIFVGMTSVQIFEAIRQIENTRPLSIKHWRADEPISIRSLEFDLTETDAKAFLEDYVKHVPSGWRYLTGPIPDSAN